MAQPYGFSRMLIVAQEDLNRDRRLTLQRVFTFLGVDPYFDHPDFDLRHNLSDDREIKAFGESKGQVDISDADRDRLVEALAPDIAQFKAYMGLDFPDWSI